MSREEEIRAELFDHTLNGHAAEVADALVAELDAANPRSRLMEPRG
jgi:hypothetical protein